MENLLRSFIIEKVKEAYEDMVLGCFEDPENEEVYEDDLRCAAYAAGARSHLRGATFEQMIDVVFDLPIRYENLRITILKGWWSQE